MIKTSSSLAVFTLLAVATSLVTDVPAQDVRTQDDILTLGPDQIDPFLGESFAIEEPWAVVSARAFIPVGTQDTGAAIVYKRGEDGWFQHSILLPEQPDIGEQFSRFSISIRNGQIAVGAALYRLAEPTGPRGRVVLFNLVGDEWVRGQELVAPDFSTIPSPYNGFGFSVNFAGDDELLVSAPSDQSWRFAGFVSGSYYVFRKDAAGDWNLYDKIRADPSLQQQVPRLAFGAETVIRGDVGICVRPGFMGEAPVTVLQRDALGDWSVDEIVDVPNLIENSRLYRSDLNDEFFVLGDDQKSCIGLGARPGRVYIYRQLGSSWSLIQELECSDPYAISGFGCTKTDGFGSSVALADNRLAVGAIENATVPGRRGRVEVFHFDGSQFVLEYILFPEETNGVQPAFGEGVAISEDTILVGATNYTARTGNPSDPTEFTRGAVFVYDLPRGDIACQGQPNSTGQPGTLAMFGSGSASIGDVYGTAQGLPAGSFCLPLIGSMPAFVPGVGGGAGDLCVGGAIGRFNGQVAQADQDGEFGFDVDAAALPLSSGLQAITSGDSWTFQVWYRDGVGGASTQNLTHAVTLTFGD